VPISDGRTLFETRRSGRTSGGSQFAHGPDGFTAYIFNGRRYRIVADKQGSVRRLVVEIGTVVALFRLRAARHRHPPGRFESGYHPLSLYWAELDNESGLYNYRARFYDPQLGRFVDIDPAGVGTIPYGYVLNDPINLTDPTGEFPWLAFLILIAITAIVGAVAGAVTYAV
jgi:RHS repeat-associated protein